MSFWDGVPSKTKDQGTPYDFEKVPLTTRRSAAAVQAKQTYQQTQEIAAPRIVSLVTATDTTAGSWNRITDIQRPSVLQLLLNGAPVTHNILVTNVPPDDETQPLGKAIVNASGTAYMLQTGSYWVYIPNLAGDPANFSAVITDASSELPAQIAALQQQAAQTTLALVNLNQVAGVGLSGFDFVGRYKPATWGTVQNKAYAAASNVVAAANGARRALSVYNLSASQTVALTTEAPATALQGFMILNPLAGYIWNPLDGVTQAAINSWGSGAGNLIVVEGT